MAASQGREGIDDHYRVMSLTPSPDGGHCGDLHRLGGQNTLEPEGEPGMIRFNSKYPPQQSMYPPEIFLTYANSPIGSFPNAFEDVLDKWAKIEFWNKDPEYYKSIIA